MREGDLGWSDAAACDLSENPENHRDLKLRDLPRAMPWDSNKAYLDVNRRAKLTPDRRPKLTPPFGKGADGSARPGGAGRGCAAGASAVR